MATQNAFETVINDATVATVNMYDAIPGTLAAHFSNFRSLPGIHTALEDLVLVQGLAGVPLGEGSMVEIGPGDGRDAESFVPNVTRYVGIGPAEGELELARQRFPDAPQDMFRVGFAQTADYPVDTDFMMSVNSVLHVPQRDLDAMNERIRHGLRMGGVLHLITKIEDRYKEEEYPDNFPGTEAMRGRTFFHHTPEALTRAAGCAGLTLVHYDRKLNGAKPWDWGIFAYAKTR